MMKLLYNTSPYTTKELLAYIPHLFQSAQHSFIQYITHLKAILHKFSDCGDLFTHLEACIMFNIRRKR